MRNLRRLALALLICVVPFALPPSSAVAAVFVSVTVAPPPLPIYVQPPIPAPGYVWIPGYWAWGPGGYYWVPGTWVLPPAVGLLWTPGWWDFDDGVYMWRPGYWGPEVGYYGGVVYGFGYTGYGFDGCYWRGGRLFYNRAVTNIANVRVVNVYNRTVIDDPRATRVSYHGGRGGTTIEPTARQQAIARGPHQSATRDQIQQAQRAQSNRMSFAAVNHGRPTVAATPRPGVFRGSRVVGGRAGSPATAQRPSPTGAPARENQRPATPPAGVSRSQQATVPPRAPQTERRAGPPIGAPNAQRSFPATPPAGVSRPQQATVPPRAPQTERRAGPPIGAPNAQRSFPAAPPPGAHYGPPSGPPRVQQAMPPAGWTHPAGPSHGAPTAAPIHPGGGMPTHPAGGAPPPPHPSGDGAAPQHRGPGE